LRCDAQHVEIGCFPPETEILANREPADAMEVCRMIQEQVETGEK
jgi:hypothetical protein